MKKHLSLILTALVLISSAVGICVKAEDPGYKDKLPSLTEDLPSDPENGCFTAIALRQYDDSLDLTSFGRLIAKKDVPVNTVTAMKYALTVYACGIKGSVYETLDKEKIKAAENLSGLVFSLHLANIGYGTGMTVSEHIDRLLARATPSGGFPTVGATPDIDMTAMAIQALAPHKDEPKVNEAIEKGLSYLSSQQTETGAFRYFGSENCENCAQVIMALSSLGIDADTDERFIKDGVSVYDALLSYRLSDGRFEHVHGGGANGAATAQAYCALINNDRLKPFYVINAPKITADLESTAETSDTEEQTGTDKKTPGVNTTVILVCAVCFVGLSVCVVMLILKKKRVIDYMIVAVVTAVIALYLGLSGVSLGGEYFKREDDIKISGYITFSVDCSLVSDKEMIPPAKVGIEENDTAYSVLLRVCRQKGMTVSNTGSKLNPYISGIGDLYEATHGPTSGWGYKVNGKAPSVGAGAYVLQDGDELIWLYVPDVSMLGD